VFPTKDRGKRPTAPTVYMPFEKRDDEHEQALPDQQGRCANYFPSNASGSTGRSQQTVQQVINQRST